MTIDMKSKVFNVMYDMHKEPLKYFEKHFRRVDGYEHSTIEELMENKLTIQCFEKPYHRFREQHQIWIQYAYKKPPLSIPQYFALKLRGNKTVLVYPGYTDMPVQLETPELQTLSEEEYFQKSTTEELYLTYNEYIMCHEIMTKFKEYAKRMKDED